MTKTKKVLLTFICLSIVGGALYKTTYAGKIDEKSIQAIKINKEKKATINTNKEKVVTEKKEEKKAKIEEKLTKEMKTEKKDKINTEKNTKRNPASNIEKNTEKKEVIVKQKPQAKATEYTKVQKERSEMVIVIDPGHASNTSLEKEPQAPGSTIMKVKEPGGAQGINTKTPEYLVNMEVAVRLKSLLEEKGYTVIMTKTENKQMLGNIARAEVGNKAKADLVIRIHADSSDKSSVNGASMLVPADNENTDAIYKISKKYGNIVLNNLINSVGMKNRGVVERNDITGFNWSKVPVILVEMGFQSNVEEDKLLATDTYQDKLAKALSEGIDNALTE
jgi:N-acetylmuramoyl-L-alanine amidase